MTMTRDLPEVGPWAREKLNGLRAYLSAYTTILNKHAPLKTVYVDAFAAAGRAVVRTNEHDDPTIHLDLGDEARDEDSREVIDGSPRVALEIEPPFEQYVFARAKLDLYFGDPGWYDEVYVSEPGLFECGVRKRSDAGGRLLNWFRGRLKTAFGHVSTARLITNSKGGHLYYLVFAGPNPTGAKIASYILGPARPRRGAK